MGKASAAPPRTLATLDWSTKGITAIEARRDAKGSCRSLPLSSVAVVASGPRPGADASKVRMVEGSCRPSDTSATNRMPLRATVRISRCSPPVSPTAFLAALMRLVSVESETIRPPYTAAMRSSLLTTRSRLWMR